MELALRPLIIVSCFAACSGTKGDRPDTDGPTDADADADADADSDSDSDADTDTGPTGPVAELTRFGEATVDGGYVGTEALVAVGASGDGEVVCRISYDVVSIGVRTDCGACDWAYDVQTGDAVVETDVGGACLAIYGVDAATVSSLNGQVTGYGYSSDYVGHAQVLLTDLRGYWASSSYATFDPVTFRFTYDWEDGVRAY